MKKKYNIGNFWKGKKQPLSVVKKKSAAIKKLYASGKWKPWNTGKKWTLKVRKKIKASSIKTWSDKKLRKRHSLLKKKQYKLYDLEKKIDRTLTNWWKEHPNIKKEYSERMKKYYAKNPALFEKFMSGGRNFSKLLHRTKFGYKVRSKSEKKVADYLFDNKINALYESKVLRLDGWLCVPDFYIPSFKVYIEYYGGYPGTYKKKVVKNRLYKKYKIPVIAITPSELKRLDLVFRRFIGRKQ